MHASLAFMNGAGQKRGAGRVESVPEGLQRFNALLSVSTSQSSEKPQGKPKDERQADEEATVETVSKPGGFKNDPDDSTNPNEVRERHLEKINK